MEIEHWLRERLARENPGPDFAQAVMRRVRTLRDSQRHGRGAGRGRFILIGTLAAVAVAAAVGGLYLLGAPTLNRAKASAADSAVEAIVVPVPPGALGAPPTAMPAGARLAAPTPVQMPPDAPGASASPLPAGEVTPVPFTIALMPLRHEQQDPAARAPVEAFYAALTAELEKVPGLKFAAPENLESAAVLARIWVISLGATSLPNGGVTYRMVRAEGSTTYNPRASDFGNFWPLEFTIEQAGKKGTLIGVGIDGVLQLSRPDAPLPAICTSAIVPRSLESRCMRPAQLAARQVEYLRLRIFPPDPVLHRQLVARASDPSVPERHRNSALHEVVNAYKQSRGFPPDAEAVRAIVSLALDAPSLRAQIWRLVRGYADSGLVQPLLDALVTDMDEGVRLEAMATLLSDYGAEARVRSAMEQVASQDASELLRMLARRELFGQGVWRDYVMAKLLDRTLPPEQRAAPLRHGSERASTPEERAAMAALVSDSQIIDAVLALARDGRSQTDIMQRAAVRHALNALMRDRDPAAADPRWQEVQSLYAEYAGRMAMPP